MNLVSALIPTNKAQAPGGQKSGLVHSVPFGLWQWGSRAATGRTINADVALTQATVFACVSLIAESVGMLPLILYKRLERGKERAISHPLYSILHDLPNPELTSQEVYEDIAGHLALWGNAYCEIERDRAGRPLALWLLRPDHMVVDVINNQRVYDYTLPTGDTVRLDRWRVWHVRGWGIDAWQGLSRLSLGKESIALALAESEYGGRFFGNDSRPGGILRHPSKLSPEAAVKLKNQWEAAHQGLNNAQRVAVLEEGIEWQSIGIEPERAQFLQSRAFQQTEICGIFRVPPHMVGIVDKSTSWGTGIGQQTQGFVTYCLGPYLRRIGQSAGRDLLTETERKTYFAEYLSTALVQNDLATRFQAYNVGRNGGWLSVNDVREAENLNPVEGGDVYLQPLNYAPLGTEPEQPAQPEPPDKTGQDVSDEVQA